MASHAQRGDLDKTAPRNVSVTTMAFVCRPVDNVSAALGTQESGKRSLCLLYCKQQFVGIKILKFPEITTTG